MQQEFFLIFFPIIFLYVFPEASLIGVLSIDIIKFSKF